MRPSDLKNPSVTQKRKQSERLPDSPQRWLLVVCAGDSRYLFRSVHRSGRQCLWDGLYQAVCILILFPLLVLAGAGSKTTDAKSTAVCKWMGEISYPLYITHFPSDIYAVELGGRASRRSTLAAHNHFCRGLLRCGHPRLGPAQNL